MHAKHLLLKHETEVLTLSNVRAVPLPTYSQNGYGHCIKIHRRCYCHQHSVVERDALPFQQVDGGRNLLVELTSGDTLIVHHLEKTKERQMAVTERGQRYYLAGEPLG